jgi:hypothetical protein
VWPVIFPFGSSTDEVGENQPTAKKEDRAIQKYLKTLGVRHVKP